MNKMKGKLYTYDEVEKIVDDVLEIRRATLYRNLEKMKIAKWLEENLSEYQIGLMTTGEIVHTIIDLMINSESYHE